MEHIQRKSQDIFHVTTKLPPKQSWHVKMALQSYYPDVDDSIHVCPFFKVTKGLTCICESGSDSQIQGFSKEGEQFVQGTTTGLKKHIQMAMQMRGCYLLYILK